MSHPHDEYPPTQRSGAGPWPPFVPGLAVGAPYSPSSRPPLPPGAMVPNVFVWLLVGTLPVMLLMAVLEILWAPGFFRTAAAHDKPKMTVYGLEILLFIVAALALRAAIIVLSFFDWRRLRKAGVVRPFHWAWAFLGPAVYMIGRTVILWKVSRNRVLAPMIAFGIGYLVLVVAGFAAGFTFLAEGSNYSGPDTVSASATPPNPSAPSNPSSAAGSRIVNNATDGFTALFRAAPQSSTAPTTLDGLTITEDMWTVKDSGYPIQAISAARFSCMPSAAKLDALIGQAEKSMMFRLTGQHGIGKVIEDKTTTIGSFPARRTTISFTDTATGTKLSSDILVIDSGSTQIIAMAIGPDGTSDPEAFVNAVHPLDGPAPTAPSCSP
ncbi:hypothetical protein [Arthrobacter bambusae]|uniref:Membrane protein n=1 Tax=Arthrobacter bambusae TaxID=1338426 RepID=A0AAW8DFW6_9MICC|nr:hypothetical protein [Arthrobacter bambusae]MDP9904791.1 putative membrane protein [Arthrobacter bambusae]MDQ0129607.1 putative membrane protein [Arthrobacter bambusae]MDQ0180780.1 putative membrane protein [Arthrobacter bambusae]